MVVGGWRVEEEEEIEGRGGMFVLVVGAVVVMVGGMVVVGFVDLEDGVGGLKWTVREARARGVPAMEASAEKSWRVRRVVQDAKRLITWVILERICLGGGKKLAI